MQLKKQMYAGLFAVLLVAAIVTIPHALADKEKSRDQNQNEKARPQKPVRQAPVTVVGVGAAVDSDGNLHRSHYRIGLANETASAYQVKKGQIFILEKGSRGTYQVIPETWKTDITDGKATFSAAGQVKGGDSTYDVSLAGTKIRDVKNASLYRVDGKMSGNGAEYELHYISTFSKKIRSAEAIADVPE